MNENASPARRSDPDGRDIKCMQLRHELANFLNTAVADEGTVNGGGGMGQEDIWLTVGGEPFHIIIPWAK